METYAETLKNYCLHSRSNPFWQEATITKLYQVMAFIINTTNSTNFSSDYSKRLETDWEVQPIGVKVFKLTVEIAIALFGVLGNILICCVVAKSTSMRSSTYYYIVSLAVADLGVLLINFPLALVKELMLFKWPFGEFFCLYIYPITDIFFGASIWSIAVIAINRYLNIARHRMIQRGRRSTSIKSSLFSIFGVWVMSFSVVNLPLFFIIDYNPKVQVCYLRWPPGKLGFALNETYMVGLVVFLYLLPLGIITFTYCCISRRLQASDDFLKTLRRENDCQALTERSEFMKREEKRMLKKNKKAKKILTPLVVLFAVSMLPLNVFRLLMTFYPIFMWWKHYWTCFSVVIVFTIINSSCNPIVYAIVSKKFRKGLENLLRCKFAAKPKGNKLNFLLSTRSTRKNQTRHVNISVL